MTGEEAHLIATTVIAEAGYGENFGHGLGHGVGLHIHEAPRLGATLDGRDSRMAWSLRSSRASTSQAGVAYASRTCV